MRSRYSAFCELEFDYLEASTHPQFRKFFDRAANEAWAREAKFQKLEVLGTTEDGDEGSVTFCAHFLMSGKLQVHREHSRFRREKRIWYFCEGS